MVCEVNCTHTTMPTAKSLGSKPDLIEVLITLKSSKNSANIAHILLSSNQEVKHTFLYPQIYSFYLIWNRCHGSGKVLKNTL